MSRSIIVSAFISVLIFISVSPSNAAVFVVDRADDASVSACTGAANDCTLRGAITAVNASADASNTISFGIPGSGVHTINLTSALPSLFRSVTINGATQSGYFGTPMIELNGAGAGAGVDGLNIAGSAAAANTFAIYALAINRFSRDGIRFACFANVISCKLTAQANFIGTDATGAADLGNGGNGMTLQPGLDGDTVIGGGAIFEGNVISGNAGDGVSLIWGSTLNTTDVTIQGNLIGTNLAGSADLGNDGNGTRTWRRTAITRSRRRRSDSPSTH